MKPKAWETLLLGGWTLSISIFMLGPLVVLIAISLTADGYISLP